MLKELVDLIDLEANSLDVVKSDKELYTNLLAHISVLRGRLEREDII
jgi:hypothetical protein